MTHIYNINILFKAFESKNGANKSVMLVIVYKFIEINCLFEKKLLADHEQMITKTGYLEYISSKNEEHDIIY